MVIFLQICRSYGAIFARRSAGDRLRQKEFSPGGTTCNSRPSWTQKDILSASLWQTMRISFSEKSRPGSLRQNRPPSRQHFLYRLPDPQGQRSFRPSFSSSSLSPWTILTPRLTCISDGKPCRRLLIVSKGHLIFEFVGLHGTPPVFEE